MPPWPRYQQAEEAPVRSGISAGPEREAGCDPRWYPTQRSSYADYAPVEGWSDTTKIVRRSAGLPWKRTPESKSGSLEGVLGSDLTDDGKAMGVGPLDKLPVTREADDTQLRTGGSTQYKAGYLPYSIVDGWQQIRPTAAREADAARTGPLLGNLTCPPARQQDRLPAGGPDQTNQYR